MRQPFHKAIVDELNRVGQHLPEISADQELIVIGRIIYSTNITEGHDEIASAWAKACERAGTSHRASTILQALSEQKQAA